MTTIIASQIPQHTAFLGREGEALPLISEDAPEAKKSTDPPLTRLPQKHLQAAGKGAILLPYVTFAKIFFTQAIRFRNTLGCHRPKWHHSLYTNCGKN